MQNCSSCASTFCPCQKQQSLVVSKPLFKCCKATLRSLPFSRLSRPCSLSLCSEQGCPSPLIISMPSSGPIPTTPHLSCRAGAQAWMQCSRFGLLRAESEEQNCLSQTVGHVSLEAAQDLLGFLGCECPLLPHIQPFISQKQVFLCTMRDEVMFCCSQKGVRIGFHRVQNEFIL